MPKYIIEPIILVLKEKNDFDFHFQLRRKEKQQKFIAKDPNNYVNRKIEKEEQAPINLDNIKESTDSKKNKLNKKKRMLEEKLKENDKAMKKIKRKNEVN